MPRVITDRNRGKLGELTSEALRADFQYKYPDGLKLKPGTELHDQLVTRLMNYAYDSHEVMSTRYDSWRKIDKTLTSFIDQDQAEKDLKEVDSRKPTSIVVPVSYATLNTLLTYWVGSLLSSETVFPLEPTGPEDSYGVILLEKLMWYHYLRQKMMLEMHTLFRDGLAYGVGATHTFWEVKRGPKQVPKVSTITDMFGNPMLQGMERNTVQNAVKFEGNGQQAIDPYSLLLDPNVPIHRVQDGEFVAWGDRTNIMALLSEEEGDQETNFNTMYLKAQGRSTQSFLYEERNSQRDLLDNSFDSMNETFPVDIINFYVTLIPRDWNIGKGKYPEKWHFRVGGDRILLRAQPLGLDHNMYPIAVCAPEYDGHSAVPLSSLEVVYGMQHYQDWLVNSHIANVRKVLNNNILVDPYLVNMGDVRDAKAGGIWTLRRAAWGQGRMNDAAKQFQVQDVTAQNMQEIGIINELIQRVTGASDTLQGMNRRTSERVTAQEIQTISHAAMSRVEHSARIGAWQSIMDLTRQFGHNIQQFMQREQMVRISGRWEETLRSEFGIQGNYVNVRPIDVMVDFDAIPGDPMLGKANFVDVWYNVLQLVMQNGEMAQMAGLDVVRIFKHWARMAGARDLSEFELPKNPDQMPQGGMPGGVQVVPDELVMQRVEQGRYVPADNPEAVGGPLPAL